MPGYHVNKLQGVRFSVFSFTKVYITDVFKWAVFLWVMSLAVVNRKLCFQNISKLDNTTYKVQLMQSVQALPLLLLLLCNDDLRFICIFNISIEGSKVI